MAEEVAGLKHLSDTVNPNVVYYLQNGRLVQENIQTGAKVTSRPIRLESTNKLEDALNDCPQRCLKFAADCSESVEVSPCGLILLSRSDKITQVPLNKSWNRGIHCWEFYCPLSCYGITIGLKEVGGRREETFDFSSSTPRTITLKLDLNRKVWMCWVNLTIPVRKPVRQLNDGEWAPFIRIKQKGNVVVLNPFAADPEDQVSQFNMLKGITAVAATEPYAQLRIEKQPLEDKPATASYELKFVGEDTLAIIQDYKMVKLLYRNRQSQRFEIDDRARVLPAEEADPLIELVFSEKEIQLIGEFSKLHNIRWLTTANYDLRSYSITHTAQQWTAMFSHMFALCDVSIRQLAQIKLGSFNKDSLPVEVPSEQWLYEVYRTIGQKVEQLKPLLRSSLEGCPVSESDRLSNWGTTHLFFRDYHPERKVSIAKSLLQNSMPPILTNSVRNIISSQHYLIIESISKEKGCSVLELFNYELVPFKVMDVDLTKGFVKAQELTKYKEIIQNMKRSNEVQPSIYKILSNCLTEAKKIKPIPPKPTQQKEDKASKPVVVAPAEKKVGKSGKDKKEKEKDEPYVDPKLLESFVQMGFPIDKCRKALIETKNVSLQVALDYFLTMTDEETKKKPASTTPKGAWSCSVCTLENPSTSNECDACGTPQSTQQITSKQELPLEVIPEAIEIQEQKPVMEEVKEERLSRDIEEQLLCYAFTETRLGTAPLVIVGCFESTMRVRLIGQNPMYYSKFHLKNEKGFIDYSDLSFHDSVETLDQRPIRYLDNVFVGANNNKNSTFGWIVLQDEDIKIDFRAVRMSISHTATGQLLIDVVGHDKRRAFAVEIRKNFVYNEEIKSVVCKEVDPTQFILLPAPKDNEERQDVVSNSTDVSFKPGSSVTVECMFSQVSDKHTLTCTNILETKVSKSDPNYIESCNGYIPLIVEEAPPGCNMHYPVCSILYPSRNTFLANYPFRVVMSHLHGKLLQVDSVVIEKIGTNKNAKSIKAGHVYLLNDSSKQPSVKHYFEVGADNKKVQVFINDPQFYKHLVVEPIYQENCEVEAAAPFEIGLVGALGKGVEATSDKISTTDPPLSLLKNQARFELYGYKGTDRHPILEYDFEEFILHDRTELERLTPQELQARVQHYLRFNIPLDVCVRLRPRDGKAYDRIHLEKVEVEAPWKLVTSRIRIGHQLKQPALTEGRTSMEEQQKKLIKDFIAGTPGKLELLVATGRQDPRLWKLFLEELPANKFIQERMLSCSKVEYELFSTVVDAFIEQPEFIRNIDLTPYLDLDRLREHTQSSEGLQLLFKIMQRADIPIAKLTALGEQLLQSIGTHQRPEYRSLRKSNNCSLSLETELFSDYYSRLVQSQQPDSSSLFESNHFLSKFVLVKNRFYRKYIIDLTNRVHVRNLLLSFDKSQSRAKMILRAYHMDQSGAHPQKKLIFEHYYQDSVWIQLTRNAYSNQMTKLFRNPIHSGLNCLAVSELDFHARYLIVEIAFTVIPNTGDQREIDTLPISEIVPEVYGEYSGQLEPLFPECFNVKPGELSFFNTLKFHEISRIAKYSFVRDGVEYFYYDNEDNMPQKESSKKNSSRADLMSLTSVRELLKKGRSKTCLDYDYTVMSMLLLVLNNKQLEVDALPEETCLNLFEVLVKGEKGPITDRTVALLRKLVRTNDKLYVKLLKQTHTLDSFAIFRDLPVKEDLVRSELLAGPCRDFVKNSIGLMRINAMHSPELLELLIKQAIKNDMEEMTVPLLKMYKVPPRLIKHVLRGLCSKQPEEAGLLIKSMKGSSQLLALAKDCLEDDYKTFEMLIDEIVSGSVDPKNEQFVTAYKSLTEHMLELFSRRDSERDLKVLLKLAKTFGLSQSTSQRFIDLFVGSRFRGKLEAQFLLLKMLKTPEHGLVLLRHVLRGVEEVVSNDGQMKKEGWLCNVLSFLTGDTSQEFEPTSCHFKTNDGESTNALLTVLSHLLNKSLMLGGIDNFKLSSLNTHRLVVLANYLATIASCSVEGEPSAVREELLKGLISWYLINNVDGKKATSNKSHLLNRFGKLSLNIKHILLTVAGKNGSNESHAKFILSACLEKVKEVGRLLPTLKEQHISHNVDKTVSRGFKRLTHDILSNPQLLSYYCCELDGFSWLIGNLSSFQSVPGISEKSTREEEQANHLTIVGEAVTPKDWLVNKAGNKSASIYNITYNNDLSKDSELLLYCEKGVLATKIVLGLTVTENADRNSVLPAEIEVYGGREKDDLQLLGVVAPLPDDHYMNYSTRVYGINLGVLPVNLSGYDQLFEQMNKNTSVNYLKLVFKKPEVFSLCDVLDVPHKNTKNLWSGISFLSVTGYLSTEAAGRKDLSCSLALLSLLAAKDNSEVVVNILSRRTLVENLKSSLNKICEATTEANQERLFHNFISVISEHNAQLGDYIIERYLTNSNAVVCAQIVGQIVLSNYALIQNRVKKLHSFVLRKLKEDSNHWIVPFVRKEIEVLHIVSLDWSNKHSGRHIAKVVLEATPEDLVNLVKLATGSWSNFKEDLVKFAVTLALAREPFVLSDTSCLKHLLAFLWKLENRLLCVDILAALLIGSEDAVSWFIDQQNMDVVFKTVGDLIAREGGQVELTNYLMFLSDLCHSPKLKQLISSSEFNLNVFRKLSTSTEKMGGPQKELRKALVEFLVSSTIGTKGEKTLANLLKESLDTLGSKENSDYLMQTELFLPILNSYSSVAVCLQPYNEVSKRFIQNANEVLLKEESTLADESKTHTNNPATGKPNQKQEFTGPASQLLTKEMQSYLCNQCPKDIEMQLAYNQAHDGLVPAFQTIKSRLLGHSFLVIVQASQEKGPDIVTGAYYQHEEGYPKLSDNTVLWLKWNPNSFIFVFEKNGSMTTYKDAKSNEPFIQFDSTPFETLEMGWTEEGGELNILLDEEQRINLSFRSNGQSEFDFVKGFGSEGKPSANEPLKFVRAEYWLVKPVDPPKKANKAQPAVSSGSLTKELLGTMPSVQLFGPRHQNEKSAMCTLRSHPVYLLPSELKIREVKSLLTIMGAVLSKDSIAGLEFYTEGMSHRCTNETTLEELSARNATHNPNTIVDLQYNAEELFNDATVKDITSKDSKKQASMPVEFLSKKGIFKAFEEAQGVKKLIEIVSNRILCWKHEDRAKKWLQYVQELRSFSCYPYFFSMYMKEKETVDLLLNLLVGLPDREEPKKWQDMETKAIRQLYKIIAEVLLLDRTLEFRQYSIDNCFITTVLDRLQLLSKEERRRFVKDFREKEEVGSAVAARPDDDDTKKIKKKKGVGYGTESSGNTKWTTGENSESKKETSEQIQNILSMLSNFLDTKEWKVPKSLVEEIMCSCLLPLIEAMLRAGTLLQISKDPQSFKCVLRVIEALAGHRVLVPCLMDLPKTYQPSQVESIYSLLKGLDNTSRIFISCLGQNSSASSEANKISEEIAKDIIKTFKAVEEAVDDYRDTDEADSAFNNILELPLDKKYRELLKDLRFDYVSMRDSNGKMKHHYGSYGATNHVSNAAKTIRLAQELADLSTSLPIEHTNSIFVRCDKERVDFMQALIMGANGTPYGHGAYLFDVYFDDSYPNGPPKVNLMTTGSGKVRFNPNLYSCGKVCLSLLGTWRGNATENWDPKVSTLLQVLVSIQAIIMSEDVYFNEPGFENEQGTDEGEKKNEAYSNIVRYSNIKYAMTENIKNPPAGFESVIRRHFYLKKDEIIAETEKWLRYAAKRDANYVGLVNDHNHNWSAEFKKSKGRYLEMLTAAVAELKTELGKIPAPSIADIATRKTSPKKRKEAQKELNANEGAADLNDIDVSYSTTSLVHKELTVDDEKVRDRWSRYIGAMGIDAVSKQAKASVLVVGLGAFSLEVVKNIVLSGCRRLTVHDNNTVTLNDLSGGFFYNESDVGKKRVASILHKIQELNQYVKVDVLPELNPAALQGYDVVFVTETPLIVQCELDGYCRSNGIKFISADCAGPYSRLFNDFGPKFEVLDKNGEEAVEVMIKNITIAEKAVVTLLDGAKHPFEDGEVVIIRGVDGMELVDPDKPYQQGQEQLKSINGTLHKIETINSNSFRIGSTLAFKPYVRNGTAKNLKLPITMQFPYLGDVLKQPDYKLPIDDNLAMYDFVKMESSRTTNNCFRALDEFARKENRPPKSWSFEDSEVFWKYFKGYSEEEPSEKLEKFVRTFSMTCQGSLPPLCAFWGGFVSQEIIKAITQKFKPTKSMFVCEFSEVVQDLPAELKDWQAATTQIQKKLLEKATRAQGFSIVVGEETLSKIESCKLFMIGAGAIGCQLLKNFAMINLSTSENGSIVLTDPDHIETSNLNRQFLFREKHLRKPKSSTAAASVIQMNPLLKGRVVARLDKVHEGTKDTFSNKFFRSLTIVANALDNVQARRYVDQRCVENKVPLLESGTLGPKGHVQVIVPHLTESYGSKNDPVEEGEIPHCTLKMFPEETLHCVEWARDKFGHKFSLKPKALLKVIEEKYKPDQSEIKTLNESLKLLKKRPGNFEDCIFTAVRKFYKYYRDDVMQLIYTYPLDAKTKNGEPFWKLPKRPPTPIKEFNPEDLLHCTFVSSYAVMLAKIFGVPFPKNFRTDKERFEVGKIASKVKIEPFTPSDKKAKSIMSETEKKKDDEEEKEQEIKAVENEHELLSQIKAAYSQDLQMQAEEFEKDDDANGHIDFIYSMANLRAVNYKLEQMDWLTTKIKAGRIVPALSTTTTAIAGLQTMELVKYIKGVKLDKLRNAFLNLAVPVVQLSEPGQVEKVKLTPTLDVTIWDVWEVKCNEGTTLRELFSQLESIYKLRPRDVFQESTPIYLSANMQITGKEKQKDELLNCKLLDLVDVTTLLTQKQQNSVDLIVTFSLPDDSKILKDVPTVRLLF